MLLTGATSPTGANLDADVGKNTFISAVSGDAASGYTLTLQYQPGGYNTPNLGVLGDIPAGSTLTFAIPEANTNFLSTDGTGSFTYDYEFGSIQAGRVPGDRHHDRGRGRTGRE